MHFKVYCDDEANVDETLTIQHFLKWQGCEQYWIHDKTTIAYTKGRSHIFIQLFGNDKELMITFTNFNEMYRSLDENGLLQC